MLMANLCALNIDRLAKLAIRTRFSFLCVSFYDLRRNIYHNESFSRIKKFHKKRRQKYTRYNNKVNVYIRFSRFFF